MNFISLDFAVFLPLVFALYWFVLKGRTPGQNALIVAASYVFYGWWDWRFLILIALSTLVDFGVALALDQTEKQRSRKILLAVSIAVNLGMLGFFKYFNFFLESFNAAFSFFGSPISLRGLAIILPVGISFYTFQTLSYTIDVYRRQLKPTRDFVAFSAFVAFFPQLVAGPIERASHLLPQFFRRRTFTYEQGADGLRQILWGLFKKAVIADNCAEYVNLVFAEPTAYSGSALLIGAVLFAFQIYCDFSGYSDIAIGTARLFGFDLKQNFAFPYFSRDVAEFWRRWHISLSTWFRDYLYIPLGGSRGSRGKVIRNIFVIFLVSGFWHGANWTFVFWGGFHALLFLPLLLLGRHRTYLEAVDKDYFLPSFRETSAMLFTFCWITIGWIFFRADSLHTASVYFTHMLSPSLFHMPVFEQMGGLVRLAIWIPVLLGIEWIGRSGAYGIEWVGRLTNRAWRWSFYAFLVLIIGMFMHTKQTDFIYFQF